MTELEQAVQRAWLAMLHGVRPMPADVALDHVQDVCGDRDVALRAFVDHGVELLMAERPEQVGSGSASFAMSFAFSLAAEGMRYDVAARELFGIRKYSRLRIGLHGECHPRGANACEWLSWADRAFNDLDRFRALSEAVAPVVAE